MVAGLLAIMASGCTRHTVHPVTDYASVERPREREIPIYSEAGPHQGVPVALVQSRRLRDRSDDSLRVQLEDIRRAALDANADAVVNLELLPVRRTGFEEDPMTPFLSPRQNTWMEYVLRGTAVIYPEKEAELVRAVEEREAAQNATAEEVETSEAVESAPEAGAEVEALAPSSI